MRMIPRARARLQEGFAGSRNVPLRAERLILSFPYLKAPLVDEDVGNCLQFFKFCETFREFFKIEKSQAESVLQEQLRGGSGQSGWLDSTPVFIQETEGRPLVE